jgi:hypothetical protein
MERIAILSLLASAAVEIVSLIVLPVDGYDAPYHLFWIGAWHVLWQHGILYPRWLSDSFRGFGAPSFYFYPPLAFVLASALYAVLPNLNPDAIGKLFGLLIFGISGVTMFLYLRWHSGSQTKDRAAHVFGALLYVFAPYRFFDYAVRGAISEHLAFVFIPLVFWGIDMFAERPTQSGMRKGMLLLALSLTLLFLSNLPAATVTGLGALIYVLFRDRNGRMAVLGKLMFSAIAAILLAAFYLLPIVVLFKQAQLGRLWYAASVVFSSPFLAIFSGLALLINSYAFLSVIGASILLVGCWRTRKDRAQNSSAILGMLVMIVFMQLPYISRFLFNFVPPFTIVQLSYRFSILLLFTICILWLDEMNMAHDKIAGIFRHSVSFVIILWSLGSIGLVSLQLANIHVHVHTPLPVGEAPEYAPRWSRPYYDFGAALSAPFASDSQYVIWRGEQSEAILRDVRQPYSDSITYDSPVAGSLLLRRSYWPTWKASLDGVPTTTEPDSLGRLIIRAPQGQHHVVVSLATENSARIGAWISVGTVIILCAIWILA